MTKQRMSGRISVASGLALSLLIGIGGTATARDVTVYGDPLNIGALTQRVSYADLNLASEAGVESLNGRVKGAVKRVCAPLDQLSTFGKHAACKSFAWNGAKPQIERATLRAQQLAANGVSAIAPVAIVISAPQG